MALQGTIDTFPFEDVLTLIASSSKIGRLTLTGDRGVGSLWLNGDEVLGGEIGTGPNGSGPFVPPGRAVFELLRFDDGSFIFESLEPFELPSFGQDPVPTAQCLAEARSMLREWETIQSKVPSTSHRVVLAMEPAVDEILLDVSTWRTLVMITRCSSVGHLALELGMDDLECARLVAGLVDDGIVEVNEPWDIDALLVGGNGEIRPDDAAYTAGDDVAPPAEPWSVPDTSPEAHIDISATGETARSDEDPVAEPSVFPDHFPIDDLMPDDLGVGEDPWGDDHHTEAGIAPIAPGQEGFVASTTGDESYEGVDASPSDAPAPHSVGAGHEDAHGFNEDWTEDVLRQMSTLSPSAAEAVAATLAGEEQIGERTHDDSVDRHDPFGASDGHGGLFGGSGIFNGANAGSSDGDVRPATEDSLEAPTFMIDEGHEMADDHVTTSTEALEDGTSISYLDRF